MLLDVDLSQVQIPEKLQPDSLRAAQEAAVELLKTDPATFWHNLGEQALHFGLKVLAAIAIYIVGAWIIGRIKKMMQRSFARRKVEPTIASFTTSLVSIVLTTLLIVMTVSALGVNTTSLAALLAAGGMAIGMALSGTVQNFAGGIMLLVFKPFQAGDYIKACGYEGTVKEVTIVSTKILTIDNRVVVLPNGTLSNGTIENFSAQPTRRVDIEVCVGYGTEVEACVAAIQKILSEDNRILTSATNQPAARPVGAVNIAGQPVPDPFVALHHLNANDIAFTIRAWVLSADYWPVYYDLQRRFYTELPKQGFGFAYPHCDVTILNAPQS